MGAVKGPSTHVGRMYGGRWCDAYPLGSDLVRGLHRGMYGHRYSMCTTADMCAMGSRDSTDI